MPAAVVVDPDVAGPSSSPGRRRVGVPLAVAVAVVLLAELVVRGASSRLAAPSAWPSPELQKKYDRIVALAGAHRRTDVVLVGDSMLDAAGDPSALRAAGAPPGIYNASIAGETLPAIADWTERIVVPRLHPRLVVIGFSANELNPAVLAPASGFAAYRRSRAVRAASGNGDVVDRADAFLRQHSYLYRYRDVLRHPLGDPAAAAVFDPPLAADGHDLNFADQGYLAGGLPHAKSIVTGIMATLAGFKVGPDNVAILQHLLAWLRGQGIAALFVAMPVTADLISLFPGGAPTYQGATAAFQSVAAGTAATFVAPGTWPTSLFADPVHLNGAGTARFSSYLAPLISSAAR
ncbi:MAG TPA: hypothetical protein VHT75_12835 [Acidimicrobiales bacterium]|nr:hypothetical protein [Acidimicrobiales bacterium]